MIQILNGRKIAILDKDENAIAKTEDTLRITSLYIDYIKREVRATFKKGFVDTDGIFTAISGGNIVVTIDDGLNKLFTKLTTPKDGEKDRWFGDFRIADFEQIAMDNNLLPGLRVDKVIEQK